MLIDLIFLAWEGGTNLRTFLLFHANFHILITTRYYYYFF